jgi:glycosyltransferase involved in cell wall biosynthesis
MGDKNDKIRVLKFLSVFMIGGTERQFVNVVKQLDRSKFEIHVGCFRKFGPLLEEINACGHPLTDYSIRSLYGYRTAQAVLRLARYLREHRIQVVHAYGLYPNLCAVPAARLARVPVVIAGVRDTGAHATPIQTRAQRWMCRAADCVVANANAVRDWLSLQGIPEQKIRVIPNGIVPREPSEPGQSAREEFGIPVDAPVVGAICRINPIKGVNYLLEAAAVVRQRHPAARFMIVGDGGFRNALMQSASDLGVADRVIFTGFRTDIDRFIQAFDISVLPSLTEGMSNTLMESMAAGVPVVATRVGGTPEIVIDGVTGILVEPRDSQTLARSILKLLDDKAEAKRIGAAGQHRITEQFSLNRTVAATERLYCELLGKAA